MTKIIAKPFFFIRHGTTEWNVKGLCQGQIDIPLNEIGIKQAHEVIIVDSTITHVYYSPLKRASETAHIVTKSLPLTKIEAPNIQERNFGELQGKPWHIKSFEELKVVEPASGEPWSDFSLRVINAINHGLTQCDHPLFVSHEGVYQAIIDTLSIS